jgi:hypothetical protein
MSEYRPKEPHSNHGTVVVANERRRDGSPRQGALACTRIRNASFAMLLAVSLACTPPVPLAPGNFIEEFDGFLIFHGDPGRPYRALGSVYRPDAAGRGASPMKRAAVAEARRLGANAILIGPASTAGDQTAPPGEPQPPPAGALDVESKWKTAVAIQLLD